MNIRYPIYEGVYRILTLEYINDMLRCNKENRNGRLKLAIC